MIAKIISGTSFRACAQYLLRNETAEMLAGSGVRFGSTDELVADFESMLLLTENAPAKPVGHTILSFSHDDHQLSQVKLCEIARSYMKEMKIEHTPWILVQHSDKKHQHIHLMYSNLNYDRRMVNQQHNFARSKKACQNIKVQFSLANTSGKHIDRTNINALRGSDLRKYEILICAKQAIGEARSWTDFVGCMKDGGVDIEICGSELSRGIRFSKGGYHFAGNKVDRSLSYRNILNGISFANAKRSGISPVLCAASHSRQQTRHLSALLGDIKQMFHTQVPSTPVNRSRDEDEHSEEEKQQRKEQQMAL